MATPEFVVTAHAHSKVVWVYTVNRAADLTALLCRPNPVDGVITDRPDRARNTRCH